MSEELRFDGRVAVITGSGAGLGRAYALLFAERGASVVVNDLGGGRDGEGSSSKAADAVVNEIRSRGGKAVADYNSVEDGDKIVRTALENFGRIDILVNNAGILRDKSFPRISDTDWELIQKVHLKGTFKTTQAAWPHFRKQNYGRIIVTSSNSGLYGNFGQANYSAAKMAVVGLSNTLAIEGAKYNVHCNVIVPTAASRLTEDILPPDFFAELRPELIAPVVAWLCHESCEDNGSIIESAVGWAGKCHLVRGKGALLRSKMTDNVCLESVRDKWNDVIDMSSAERLNSIEEASGTLMTVLEELKTNQEGKVNRVTFGKFSYDHLDTILYALGVGATVTNPGDMRFLYEVHEDFSVLPTYWVLPGQMAVMGSNVYQDVIPGKEINPMKALHGEQYLEVLSSIPTSGTLESRCEVVDVIDKGSGAVILIDTQTFNEAGELVIKGQMTVFAVGAGNFGGKRTSDKAVSTVTRPNTPPDAFIQNKTNEDQAALYRLSGDWNPLHIDPTIASFSGFHKPILHGLCTLGFSARHVIEQYAGNDVSLFKAIKARFAKPVYPGQTLQTNMWQQGSRILFETIVVETGDAAITGAYVDLAESPRLSLNRVSASSLKSDAIFGVMEDRIKANLEKVKKINGVFVYKITKSGKDAATWTLDLKEGKIYKGEPKGTKADTTLTLEDEDMVDMASGKLNPQVAFMKGKLKIKGNVMLTQKLRTLMMEEAKL